MQLHPEVKKLRRLMIDDEPIMKKLIHKIDDEGLDLATTFEEAIEKLSSNPPYDVVYLDYKLPGLKTGDDVLDFMEENPEKIPDRIIIISFHPDCMMNARIINSKLIERKVR